MVRPVQRTCVTEADAALAAAQRALSDGKIVGIKGNGGYHPLARRTTPTPWPSCGAAEKHAAASLRSWSA